MKKILTLVLAAGIAMSCAAPASAIDFKAKGEWLVGFGLGQGSLLKSVGGKRVDHRDKFSAAQRIRLQLDAVASENLSGTVFFELGDTTWGHGRSGGALGADGRIVEVKRAYIDWMVPQTDVKVRMGLQGVQLPNAAGGSAVFDDDVAGVSINAGINENFGITFTWARPLNDNYREVDEANPAGSSRNGYLDNLDLFALAVPITYDGVEVTPWIMYGMIGKNAFRGRSGDNLSSGNLASRITSGYSTDRWNATAPVSRRDFAYGSAFWAGLPVKLTLWDPWNVEFDFNYGYVQNTGATTLRRADLRGKSATGKAEGWLVKALVEYKLDWGVPGIFGWYASGDDGNPRNGSERMPAVTPKGNFTSFLGDGNLGWASEGSFYDRGMNYAGTWGIGLQVRDMSFLEDLKHTFRVNLRGGTNSPSMAKYASSSAAWESYRSGADNTAFDDSIYLTTNDYLLEFNLVNSYQMYENFNVNFELGYLVNMIDRDTWKKAANRTAYSKQDGWKAQLVFAYTF